MAQYLFGPQVFRFMLFRACWYFISNGEYYILPLTILPEGLSEYVNTLNIVSNTQRKSANTNDYLPLSDKTNIREIIKM